MESTISLEQAWEIRRQTEALAGEDIGEQGQLLVVMAWSLCRAFCCREDVPPEMEPIVAMVALRMWQNSEGAKTIQRGDTSVTYEDDKAFSLRMAGLLEPFRRLGRVR